MEFFTVSVIVVCLNERKNIENCLNSIIDQTFDRNQYEIIVVDNRSTDGTIEILDKYLGRQKIKVFTNPIRGIAKSRNIGVDAAKGELVAFLDADCIAPSHWLASLIQGYHKYQSIDSKIIAVGGSNIPPGNRNRFYQNLGVFLNSYLGSHGSVQGKRFVSDRYVPHLPTVNVLYNKARLIELGCFDESFTNIGEDQDLSFRAQLKNYRMYYLSHSSVTHLLRDNLKKWMKNMFLYGKGRIWLIKKYPDKTQPLLLLPMLLVPMIFAFPFYRPLGFLVLTYFVTIFVYSIYVCTISRKISLVFDLFILYICTHISYGLGELYGIFKKRINE